MNKIHSLESRILLLYLHALSIKAQLWPGSPVEWQADTSTGIPWTSVSCQPQRVTSERNRQTRTYTYDSEEEDEVHYKKVKEKQEKKTTARTTTTQSEEEAVFYSAMPHTKEVPALHKIKYQGPSISHEPLISRCLVAEKHHARWRHTHADWATTLHAESDLDPRLKFLLIFFRSDDMVSKKTSHTVHACLILYSNSLTFRVHRGCNCTHTCSF